MGYAFRQDQRLAGDSHAVHPAGAGPAKQLTLTGSGDIKLIVDLTTIDLAGIDGSIVIDSVLQEAYKGTTLMNEHMSGDFPILVPGLNAISWTGNVTSVVVKPDWRYL